jgi:hypothetical protein
MKNINTLEQSKTILSEMIKELKSEKDKYKILEIEYITLHNKYCNLEDKYNQVYNKYQSKLDVDKGILISIFIFLSGVFCGYIERYFN